MPEFQSLKLKQFAQVQDRETGESKYWKSFKIAVESKFHGAPNSIHFNPVDCGSYLVTGSAKVSLFNAINDKIMRSFSRFIDEAFSGCFRKDGKVILAGDKMGNLKVFDSHSKAILREIKGHSSAVRSTVWTSDGLHMLSGSDDTKVKCWDLATQELLWDSGKGHTDYVRTLAANPSNTEMWASGSYDHTVKLWDSRQSKHIASLQHDFPIESCLIPPSGTILASAAGSEVKIWDLLGGGRLLHTFSNHQKNITSLALDGTNSRLLSGGLDGHVKVYNLQTLQVAHGIKVNSPVLSLGISSQNSKLIIGFVDGSLVTRNRQLKPSDVISTDLDDSSDLVVSKQVSRQNKFYKSAGLAVSTTDVTMIESERRIRLRPYEKQLQKFNYQNALDTALKTHNPLVIVTVLEELLKRSALTIALSGRDEITLEPLLSFAARYISHPRYSKLIVQVAHRIVDLYASILGRSDSIDELFLKLQRQVKCEVGFQRQIMRIIGSLDGIINSASLST